jgi:uncharacterized protein (DUF302 family)
MTYYFSKIVSLGFDEALAATRESLTQNGFGVLTEIDVKETLHKKLGADFRPYRILGACNPTMAHKALQAEDKVGTMLPCNVVVQQREDGQVEVAAVDPVASMQAIHNPELASIATEVQALLRKVVESLPS